MTIGPAYGSAYGAGAMDRAQMLASTADRERAVEFLKTAFAEGRLSAEEYEGRMSRALAARTYADLDALTTDLPGTRPPLPLAPMGTNVLAVVSLVCGIAQFFGFWLLATIPAIVCGHMARRQIRRSGEQGGGLAMAGLVLGWVGAGLTLVLGLIIGIAVAVAVAHSGQAGTVVPGGGG